MPRTAFALQCLPQEEAAWRRGAAALLGEGARAHRAFLGGRRIYRERVWLQVGGFAAPLTMALWDCDDPVVARTGGGAPAGEHERWLCDTVLTRFHGEQPGSYAIPRTELLGGTTTMATAVSGSQSMVALPVPAGRAADVRALLAELESPSRLADHEAFLASASIHEEWIWLQRAAGATPDVLLVHWIGDDLDRVWKLLADPRGDPGARAVAHDLLGGQLGLDPDTVAGWQVDQLVAMHVRRSDTGTGAQTGLVSRIGGALTRRRWTALQAAFHPVVQVNDHPVAAAEAIARVRGVVDRRGADVTDVLLGRHQIVATLRDGDGGCLAVVFEVEQGAVSSLRVMVDVPTP